MDRPSIYSTLSLSYWSVLDILFPLPLSSSLLLSGGGGLWVCVCPLALHGASLKFSCILSGFTIAEEWSVRGHLSTLLT